MVKYTRENRSYERKRTTGESKYIGAQMNKAISFDFKVAWGDLDANRHMRNTRYLDYAAQCRFLYFASKNFTPKKFEAHGIGPVVLTETMSYRRELRFLEDFEVRLLCGGRNEEATKYLFVNQFVTEEERLHGELRTLFMWFDLKTRRAIKPPYDLLETIKMIPNTEDYEVIA